MTAIETCENCGRTIGKLEPACLHEGHVVCAACKGELSPVITLDYAAPVGSRTRKPLIKGQEICPNPHCGQLIVPIREARGSIWVIILLCFLGVIPGVIYMIFFSGYRFVCPECGLVIRDKIG